MKKQLLVTVIAMIPAMSFAKVSDFNAMISDNLKEQNQLHSTVTENVGEAREVDNSHERIVIVENSTASYNAPTKKEMLNLHKRSDLNWPRKWRMRYTVQCIGRKWLELCRWS